MSDEPTPPSLRLKPRQPPAPPAPDPVAPVSEPVPEPTVESDPLRLRLKPKAPPPEGPSPDTSNAPFSTPAPFSSPPMPSTESGGPLPVEPSLPAPIVSVPLPVPPPISPVKPPLVSPLRPQHLPTPRGLADPAASLQKNSPPPAIKADKWLAGVVLFVLVLIAAFYGIRYLIKAHPKPPVQATATTPATSPAAQPAPAPNRPKLVDNPTSAAGKTIAQARDTIAAHDKREKEQGVTSLLEEPSDPASTKPPARTGVAPVSAASSEITPAASAEPEPPPPPSEAFRQFVINLRVNGVFQGENARAMLNGRMYHLGDVVDVKLGISLFRIEVEAKQIVFRDASGALMLRHY